MLLVKKILKPDVQVSAHTRLWNNGVLFFTAPFLLHVYRMRTAEHACHGFQTSLFLLITDGASAVLSKSTDKYYRTQVQLLLAESMLHASKIHRSHGKYDMALKFANNGLALLDNSSEDIEETPHDKYLKSQLCFAIGSIKAIRDEDHPEAVEWYTKARSAVVGSNFITPLYSNQGHGQMYVSMGLSYWEVGEQEKAIKVTQTGANLMKQAVESGSLQLQAMAVPYGNLATMHGKLGKGSKSQEYAKLVAKLESVTKQQR